MIDMKITKGFVLAVNETEEYVFTNESDRNEMALAIYEEDVFSHFFIEVNWYGRYYTDMAEYLSHDAIFARMLRDAHEVVNENMLTYETNIVEG